MKTKKNAPEIGNTNGLNTTVKNENESKEKQSLKERVKALLESGAITEETAFQLCPALKKESNSIEVKELKTSIEGKKIFIESPENARPRLRMKDGRFYIVFTTK